MPSAKWVVTTIDLTDIKKGYKDALNRLFTYINGANNQGDKMNLTVPFIKKWFLNDKYQVESAQMAIYISSKFQANPPTPTDDLLTVETWADAITYDRAFGADRYDPGYYGKQFKYLWKALAKEDIKPHPKMAITAGYTNPGHGRQRTEVMLVDNSSM